MVKRLKLEEKPLRLMNVSELKTEKNYREGLRYAYDGDDRKMHRNLQLRVDEVTKHLEARIQGLHLPEED